MTAASPLTRDHFRILDEARRRARKVRRGASVARVSGWLTAVFAAITILGSLTSPVGLALGIGMAIVAWNEFRGSSLLLAFDARGPSRLATGQIILGVMLVAYAGAGLAGSILAPPAAPTPDPQVNEMLAEIDLDGLYRTLNIGMYTAVAISGLLVPGLTAFYYRTRAWGLRDFLGHAPPWAVEALRA